MRDFTDAVKFAAIITAVAIAIGVRVVKWIACGS